MSKWRLSHAEFVSLFAITLLLFYIYWYTDILLLQPLSYIYILDKISSSWSSISMHPIGAFWHDWPVQNPYTIEQFNLAYLQPYQNRYSTRPFARQRHFLPPLTVVHTYDFYLPQLIVYIDKRDGPNNIILFSRSVRVLFRHRKIRTK